MRDRNTSALIAVSIASLNLAGLSGAAAGPGETERLVVSPPPGFIVGKHVDQGTATITEYVPKGETASTRSRTVTVQVLHGLKTSDPDSFAESLKGPWIKGCEDAEVHQVSNRDEHGYPTSLWMYTCPLNTTTGAPETMFVKVISGNDNLYTVQLQSKSAMDAELASAAMDFFGGVRACDPTLPDRPCPAAGP
jgi:hypothetical protein